MYPRLFINTPFEVPAWEFCLLAGFIVVMALLVAKRPADFALTRAGIFGLSWLMLVCSIFGAKILFVFLHQDILHKGYSFARLFSYSGYVLLGAIMGEVFAVFAFTKFRFRRISFLEAGDYFMPFLLLQLAFVKTGCFLNGCCYGAPTDLPWRCVFRRVDLSPRHPTQVYEMITLMAIFFLMRHLYKKDMPKGVILWSSIGIYCALRFFIEFFRIDNVRIFGVITQAHIVMLCLAVVSGLIVKIIFLRSVKK
jgi:phosphatidylglycerol:prolipoprotein diacylglycerol transferase